MTGSIIPYHDGETLCEAYVARPEGDAGAPRPAVIVIHTVAGRGDAEHARADALAALGYVGIAIDVYGKAAREDPARDNMALLQARLGDRGALRSRLLAAVAFARSLAGVDPDRLAAIGFCFGGACALDIARGGARGVLGVASFHGLLASPDIGPQPPIAAKVLVLHGYDDPMATPAAMLALADEMTAAGADWQVHAYGHTLHGFTNPAAASPERGLLYNERAARRSWATAVDFLAEALAG